MIEKVVIFLFLVIDTKCFKKISCDFVAQPLECVSFYATNKIPNMWDLCFLNNLDWLPFETLSRELQYISCKIIKDNQFIFGMYDIYFKK